MSYALGEGSGPLRGVRVVEIAGIGPGPHACMLLADLGADVIRIERPGGGLLSAGPPRRDEPRPPERRRSTSSTPTRCATVLDLVAGADVLVEGLRPGAMERLGPRSRRLPRAQPARWSTAG